MKEAYGSSTGAFVTEVPARVCPASKSVPSHKDKPDGKGACVSSWTCVVYLTMHPGTALVLEDDVTGREFRVGVEPGRVCCWPNARFTHRVDADSAFGADGLSGTCSVRWRLTEPRGTVHATMGFCTSRAGAAAAAAAAAGGGCDGGGCGGGGTVGGAVGFSGMAKAVVVVVPSRIPPPWW